MAERPLLKRTDWAAEGGQLWAVVGANGAGKSTFLSLLAGVQDAQMSSGGRIEINGRALASFAPKERAAHLAYLPQHPETPPTLTVRETVMLGRAPYRSPFAGPAPADHAAVDAALDRLDLRALAARDPRTLSGGERQRMHFARICAQSAQIWLLDEPYGHLDVAHQAKLLDDLARLVAELRVLAVVVAHDLFFLPRVATHMALLHEAAVIAQGSLASVWTAELAQRSFGVPFRTAAWLAPSWRA